MKWENLRKNKCPQCNKDFMKGLLVSESQSLVKSKGVDCYNHNTSIFIHKCGFKISQNKFKELTIKMNSEKL